MTKKENIHEKLVRLNREWDETLRNLGIYVKPCNRDNDMGNIDRLMLFGLSRKEAKAWIKREPNYPSDVSYHDDESDDKLPEPARSIYDPNMIRLILSLFGPFQA